jgi:hypothetical protein
LVGEDGQSGHAQLVAPLRQTLHIRGDRATKAMAVFSCTDATRGATAAIIELHIEHGFARSGPNM